jgi:2-amino-4-hydroxy-6-hydroxymethyldihydropteridine diphosphokinase
MKTNIYIALGSNLAHPSQQITQAIEQIANHPSCQLQAVSRYYLSEPMGPVTTQPDFVNAAIGITSQLNPFDLLTTLQNIEHSRGRTRTLHMGPRTLDLDLLLYGDLQLESEQLTLPHPRMKERNFVLAPLIDIAPDLILPTGEFIQAIFAQCQQTRLEPLADGFSAAHSAACDAYENIT